MNTADVPGESGPREASLSGDELQAIQAVEARSEAVACRVCLANEVQVSLRPCGHTCLCAPCTVLLLERDPQHLTCPVCRQLATERHRVYL